MCPSEFHKKLEKSLREIKDLNEQIFAFKVLLQQEKDDENYTNRKKQEFFQKKLVIQFKEFHLKTGQKMFPRNIYLYLIQKRQEQHEKFIEMCKQADERVQAVMIIVKYWAHYFNLTESSNVNIWNLTDYALSILVIFYMQIEKVLPNVRKLQHLMDNSESCVIGGWECGFTSDITEWKKQSSNIKSVAQLLHGFFKFYAKSNFDLFEKRVVSPYLGSTFKKDPFGGITFRG